MIARRVMGAAAIFICWSVAIEARLVYLQVAQHDEMLARAARQQMRTVPASAQRGEILDRHGRILAYSVDADTVYAVPTEIDAPEQAASALCGALDDCTPEEQARIARRLGQERAFAYVRRQISPEEAKRIELLQLDGVGFLKETRRYYPNKQLAAHLLGYVGVDSVGLHGIESVYDTQIRGRPGKILIQTDARRRAFSRIERPPTAGATLELTIDRYLQHVAERELRSAVQLNHADGGTVIVMDPYTGELLALANEPTFNPNAFLKFSDDQRRNRATQDIYEPGSTFKMVTASAALEEQVLSPDDLIDVSAGMIRLGARQINDVSRYGVLSFADVFVKSSNVGAVKIGLQLGSDRLGRYVRRFGFGQRLSRDFAGESVGIVWDPMKWTEGALASISMGYQIGVTPLQMVTAASAVANGGRLMEPRLVHAIRRESGRVVVRPHLIRRTIEADTASRLTAIMEQVVERGTGRAARISGYRLAGKTGTTAKLVNGHYSKREYNASFVGFFPARHPVYAILVVIDTPRGDSYYGGAVAAPVFRRVVEAAIRYRGVPPSVEPNRPLIVERRGDEEAVGPHPAALRSASTPVTIVPARTDRMPDLTGLGVREALRTLARVGLDARVIGDGVVVAQEPAAGTSLADVATTIVRLDREMDGARSGAR